MTKLRYIVIGMFALVLLPALGWAASPWGQGGLPGELKACEAELEECVELPCAIFPGDGWPEDPPPYALPGGIPLRYTDNRDGTFTDDNTGLMWEIKTDDGSVNDVDNTYTWTAEPYGTLPNGTIFTEFLAELNGTLFAGYDDWRLPMVKELQSLVDYSVFNPAVSNELPGATAPYYYWSSTAFAYYDDGAWLVLFLSGHVEVNSKGYVAAHVRAVRGP